MRLWIPICMSIIVASVGAEVEEATQVNEVLDENAGDRLIWSDEFHTLDSGKWTHLVTAWDGGNGEFQYYRDNRKNSFAKDGKLFIRPTPTIEDHQQPGFLDKGTLREGNCNMEPCSSVGGGDIVSPYFSARLFTKNKFSFKYGRVVIRAKMPKGDWLWPAIWMMPEGDAYGQWPRSGEIDIVESRGNPKLTDPGGHPHGFTEVSSALHFGSSFFEQGSVVGAVEANHGQNFADDFHVYELKWTERMMSFTVDGRLIKKVDIPAGGFGEIGHLKNNIYKGHGRSAPFDRNFHLIVNVAIGGGFFPDNWSSDGRHRPWRVGDVKRQFWNSRSSWINTWGHPDDHSLQIDYIRVYQ